MLLKYFLFACFFCANIVFAQTTQNSKKINDFEIVQDCVDQNPNFPGGISAFRIDIYNKMNTDSIIGTGILRTEVTFVIEKDGSISNIKANGNHQVLNIAAENAINSIKEKWTPATKDGKLTRYRFKVPLQLRFE